MTRQAGQLSPSSLLVAIKSFNTAAMDSRASWIPSLRLEIAFMEARGSSDLTGRKETSSGPSELQEVQPSSSSPDEEQVPVDDDLAKDKSIGSGFNAIQQHWREILQATRQFDPRTQALLNSSTPLGLENDELILGFRSDLLREKMEKNHNLSNAKRAAAEVLGYQIKFRCVLMGAWRPEPKVDHHLPTMEDGGMVATAVRDFGAHVVDVEKLPPEK